MRIRPITKEDFEVWQELRRKLWSHIGDDESRVFLDESLQNDKTVILVAESRTGSLIGFLEAGLRNDYVEGCETSPVGYIEGWYVDDDFREQGIGRKLTAAAEDWARSLGCREMASDCVLDNTVSLLAHLGSGYIEVERSIHFKKNL